MQIAGDSELAREAKTLNNADACSRSCCYIGIARIANMHEVPDKNPEELLGGFLFIFECVDARKVCVYRTGSISMNCKCSSALSGLKRTFYSVRWYVIYTYKTASKSYTAANQIADSKNFKYEIALRTETGSYNHSSLTRKNHQYCVPSQVRLYTGKLVQNFFTR